MQDRKLAPQFITVQRFGHKHLRVWSLFESIGGSFFLQLMGWYTVYSS